MILLRNWKPIHQWNSLILTCSQPSYILFNLKLNCNNWNLPHWSSSILIVQLKLKCSTSGLFHRAILMSGSSFSTWSLVEDPVHYAVKVASSLNCTVPTNMMKNHQDIVKCLRQKPLKDIMSVDVKAPSFLTAMGPSRDGVLIPSDFGTSSIHIRYQQ